jgi:hypothetical protein
MGNATRTAAGTLLVAGLACSASGCADTLNYSRGRNEHVLDQQVVSSRPVREEPIVEYEVRNHSLVLKVVHRKMCQRQIHESYQVVERVEHVARRDWWLVPTLGLASAVGGGAMLKYAPSTPTEGTDSEGKPTKPRQAMYAVGGLLLGIGLLAILDFPVVGMRDHVQETNSRMVSDTAACGDRPFVGPVTLTHVGLSLQVALGDDGRAAVDLTPLAGGDAAAPVMVVIESLNIQRELPLSPQDVAALRLE